MLTAINTHPQNMVANNFSRNIEKKKSFCCVVRLEGEKCMMLEGCQVLPSTLPEPSSWITCAWHCQHSPVLHTPLRILLSCTHNFIHNELESITTEFTDARFFWIILNSNCIFAFRISKKFQSFSFQVVEFIILFSLDSYMFWICLMNIWWKCKVLHQVAN